MTDRSYKYNVILDEKHGKIEATIIDLDITLTAPTEEEVIRMVEERLEAGDLPPRFLWCISCRRYEARGTVEHIARRGRRRKKRTEGLSVEDELIAGEDEE